MKEKKVKRMTQFQWLQFLYRGKDKKRTSEEIYNKCGLSYFTVTFEFTDLKMTEMIHYSFEDDTNKVFLSSVGLDEYMKRRRERFYQSSPLVISIIATVISIVSIIISVMF